MSGSAVITSEFESSCESMLTSLLPLDERLRLLRIALLFCLNAGTDALEYFYQIFCFGIVKENNAGITACFQAPDPYE